VLSGVTVVGYEGARLA